MSWDVKSIGKIPEIDEAILIEGLPGIGNVGKVVVDFLVDELKAKKIFEFFSYSLPHTVFVNENNLVDLPSIELYYVKRQKQSLLLLAGDVQPIDEVSSYQFSDEVLKLAEQFGTKKIITLGGIGLGSIPKNPKVYCTGNSKSLIKQFKKGTKLNDNLFGIVGPIVGVSGLLLGLSKKRQIQAITFLAETYGHPLYIGVKGARKILDILNKKLELNIDVTSMDSEIFEMDSEFDKRKTRLKDVAKQSALSKMRNLTTDTSYIG